MAEKFSTLCQRFVAIFVFPETAKSEFEATQPQFGEFLMHNLVMLFWIDVGITVENFAVFSSAHGIVNHDESVDEGTK